MLDRNMKLGDSIIVVFIPQTLGILYKHSLTRKYNIYILVLDLTELNSGFR